MSDVLPLQKGIIYGPVNSKRLGRSLGINLFPTSKKVCSFDCAYCHYGRTQDKTLQPDRADLPSVDEVISAVEQALKSTIEFDFITFSGNGEPMVHPDFPLIVRKVRELRDKYRQHTPLTLLSNSSCLTSSVDIDTLSLIENRIFKLDCADQKSFEIMNNACTDIQIEDIINGLEKISKVLPITIQTVFVDDIIQNYKGEIFDTWLNVIKRIKPQKIQVYSTDRPVAQTKVKMISNEKLHELAILIQDKTGIPTRSYDAQKSRR